VAADGSSTFAHKIYRSFVVLLVGADISPAIWQRARHLRFQGLVLRPVLELGEPILDNADRRLSHRLGYNESLAVGGDIVLGDWGCRETWMLKQALRSIRETQPSDGRKRDANCHTAGVENAAHDKSFRKK
jgi:hypothetical protein